MAQQNVEEGMVLKETLVKGSLVEGALFDRSTYGKTAVWLVAKDTANKKLEDKLLLVKWWRFKDLW